MKSKAADYLKVRLKRVSLKVFLKALFRSCMSDVYRQVIPQFWSIVTKAYVKVIHHPKE